MNYTPEEVAKLLADKPQQPHYIAAMIRKCVNQELAALAWAAPDWVIKAINSADEMLTQQGFAHTDLRAARDYLRERTTERTPQEILLAYENLLADHERLKAKVHAPAKAREDGRRPIAWAVDTQAHGLCYSFSNEFIAAFPNAPVEFVPAPKAREVTDADVRRACDAYADKMAELYGEGEATTGPMRAALATFAEGAE